MVQDATLGMVTPARSARRRGSASIASTSIGRPASASSFMEVAYGAIRAVVASRSSIRASGRARPSAAATAAHLGHQRADQRDGVRIRHQLVGGRVEDHRQGVEADVPQQLAPARPDEVLVEKDRVRAAREVLGDGPHQRRDPAGRVAGGVRGDRQGTEVEVRHAARAGALGAQERQPAEHLATGRGGGVRGLGPDPVLRQQDPRAGPSRRSAWSARCARTSALAVAFTATIRTSHGRSAAQSGATVDVVEVDVALGGRQVQAVLPHVLGTGAHEELHVGPRMSQPDPVEASDCSGPDHRIPQHESILPRPPIRSRTRTPRSPSGPAASGGCCVGCARRAGPG